MANVGAVFTNISKAYPPVALSGNGQVMFAQDTGAAFIERSVNRGQSWSSLSIRYTASQCLSDDGTKSAFFTTDAARNLYINQTIKNVPNIPSNAYSVVAMSGDGSTVYVSLNVTGHFYKTVDGGLTFTNITPVGATGYPIALWVSRDGLSLIVRAANDYLRSTDGGLTYTPITLPASTNMRLVATSDLRTLYLVSSVGPSPFTHSLHRSTDGGDTWTIAPLPTALIPTTSIFSALTVSGGGRTLIATIGNVTICSYNAGATWELGAPNINSLLLSKDGTVASGKRGTSAVVSAGDPLPPYKKVIFYAEGFESDSTGASLIARYPNLATPETASTIYQSNPPANLGGRAMRIPFNIGNAFFGKFYEEQIADLAVFLNQNPLISVAFWARGVPTSVYPDYNLSSPSIHFGAYSITRLYNRNGQFYLGNDVPVVLPAIAAGQWNHYEVTARLTLEGTQLSAVWSMYFNEVLVASTSGLVVGAFTSPVTMIARLSGSSGSNANGNLVFEAYDSFVWAYSSDPYDRIGKAHICAAPAASVVSAGTFTASSGTLDTAVNKQTCIQATPYAEAASTSSMDVGLTLGLLPPGAIVLSKYVDSAIELQVGDTGYITIGQQHVGEQLSGRPLGPVARRFGEMPELLPRTMFVDMQATASLSLDKKYQYWTCMQYLNVYMPTLYSDDFGVTLNASVIPGVPADFTRTSGFTSSTGMVQVRTAGPISNADARKPAVDVSYDYGATFTQIDQALLRSNDISPTVAISNDGTRIGIAFRKGATPYSLYLLISSDGGITFSAKTVPVAAVANTRIGNIAFGEGSDLYVVVNSTILYSPDLGDTFLDRGALAGTISGFAVHNNVMYVATNSYTQISKSTDKGVTLTSLPATFGGHTIRNFTVTESGRIVVLAGGLLNPDELVYVSDDSGITARSMAFKIPPEYSTYGWNGAFVEPGSADSFTVIINNQNPSVTMQLSSANPNEFVIGLDVTVA